MNLLAAIKKRAHHLRTETYALYLAARDHRSPWYAKLLVAAIVAYALSPLDLIPDFLPVIGYLDDLILIPLGIVLAIKLIPQTVLDDCRVRALESLDNKMPVNWTAGIVIVVIWVLSMGMFGVWIYNQIIQ